MEDVFKFKVSMLPPALVISSSALHDMGCLACKGILVSGRLGPCQDSRGKTVLEVTNTNIEVFQ